MHKKCFKSTEIMRFLKETSLIADVGNEYSRVRKCKLLTGRIQAFVIYSFEIHKPPHSHLASFAMDIVLASLKSLSSLHPCHRIGSHTQGYLLQHMFSQCQEN